MGPQDDYIETVLTCEGDYYDPDFPTRLKAFKQNLEDLLIKDKEHLILKKVEPWNSVRVTINIPKEAALRLKRLAETRDPSLRDIGILAVQIEGDNVISLTLAGKNNETTELIFRTNDVPQPGPSRGFPISSSTPGPSNVNQGKDLLQLLGEHLPKPSKMLDGLFQQQIGMAAFKPPIVMATKTDPMSSTMRSHMSMATQISDLKPNAPCPPVKSVSFPTSSASRAQSFPAPALSRNVGNPKGPLHPQFPLTTCTPTQNIQPPPPYPVSQTINNVPHSMMLNKGAIPASSQLLVTLLQNEMAAVNAGHVNNFQIKKSPLPSPVKERLKEKEFEETSPQPKRKRKPKPKDGPKAPQRTLNKVDSATRDKFIAQLDDIFTCVIGDPIVPRQRTVIDTSFPESVLSTTAPSPQNVTLPNIDSVNTVMESNLPGYEPKLGTYSAVNNCSDTGSLDSENKLNSDSRPILNSGSNSNNNRPLSDVQKVLQRGQLDHTRLDSLESMIINPYTGQLEPIDSIQDGTIVNDEDGVSKLQMTIRNSVSPKAASMATVNESENTKERNVSVPLTTAVGLHSSHIHVPSLAYNATMLVQDSKLPISPSVLVSTPFTTSTLVQLSNDTHKVAKSSSHPPTSSCASVGHTNSVVRDKGAVLFRPSVGSDINCEQKASVAISETGYSPQVGAVTSQKSDGVSETKNTISYPYSSGSNSVKSGYPDSPQTNFLVSNASSPVCVMSPAHLNHDSDLSSHSIDDYSCKNGSNIPSSRSRSPCGTGSSPYATSVFSSSYENVSNTLQVVTMGCVLAQPNTSISAHSRALVPNVSKHEHSSDNVTKIQACSPDISTSLLNHITENVGNSEKDSKLFSTYPYSCSDSVKLKSDFNPGGNVPLNISRGLVGGSMNPSITVSTMAAFTSTVMPRDSHSVDANKAVPNIGNVGHESVTASSCDTHLSAFVSTRGTLMQLPPEMGIKTEAAHLMNLPPIPPAVMAKLQPGPLLTRPEHCVTNTSVESRILDGNKLVSGIDTMRMTYAGRVQSSTTQNTPSPLHRPIMSTFPVQSVRQVHKDSEEQSNSDIGAHSDKPQDTLAKHSHFVADSINTVDQSLLFGASSSSAGLDNQTNLSFRTDIALTSANTVHNCNDLQMNIREKSEIKLSLPVTQDVLLKTEHHVDLSKIPNLIGLADKASLHHKKGISIMKPMFDRDAELVDEVKQHLPITDIQKSNVLKKELKINSGILNTNVSHRVKNVLNTDKMLEFSDNANPCKNKIMITASDPMPSIAPPLSQLNTITKAMSKDSETSNAGRSVSPRSSAASNPNRSMPDINFYNSSLHPITAPIFPFNLTQSVKKVVGPIPSSDTTKPAKLKMAGTSPPRSTSPRGSKASLHNVSHADTLSKGHINTGTAVSTVNIANMRTDVQGYVSAGGSVIRTSEGIQYHHGPAVKNSPRRGSSPKAQMVNPPHALPPLANMAAGVPGLHMLTPSVNPCTCASNSISFHSSSSSNYHHGIQSLHQLPFIRNAGMLAGDSKSRYPVSTAVSSQSGLNLTVSPSAATISPSTENRTTSVMNTSMTVMNLSKTISSRVKQTAQRPSPVITHPPRSSPSFFPMASSTSRFSTAFAERPGLSQKRNKSVGIDVLSSNVHVSPVDSIRTSSVSYQPVINASEADKKNGGSPNIQTDVDLKPIAAPSVPVGLMDHAYFQFVNSKAGKSKNIETQAASTVSNECVQSSVNTFTESMSSNFDRAHSANNNTFLSDLSKVDHDRDSNDLEPKLSWLPLKHDVGEDNPIEFPQSSRIIAQNCYDQSREDNNSDISELGESHSSLRSLRNRMSASEQPDSPVHRTSRHGRNKHKTAIDDLEAKSDRSESPKPHVSSNRVKRKLNDDCDDFMYDSKRGKLDPIVLPSNESLNCIDSADDAEICEMNSRKSRSNRGKSIKPDDRSALPHNTRSSCDSGKGGGISRSSSRGASEYAENEDHTLSLDIPPVHSHDTRSRTRTTSRKASDECSSDGGRKADEPKSQNRRNPSSRSRSPVNVREKSPPRGIRDKSPPRGSKIHSKVSPPKERKESVLNQDIPARRTTRSSKPKDNHEPSAAVPVGKRRRSSREHK